jgi:hypothetical protein
MASPPDDRTKSKNANLFFVAGSTPKNAEALALTQPPGYREGYYHVYNPKRTPKWTTNEFLNGPAITQLLKERKDILGIDSTMSVTDRVQQAPKAKTDGAGLWLWNNDDKKWRYIERPTWYDRLFPPIKNLFFPPGFKYIGQIRVLPRPSAEGHQIWNPDEGKWEKKAGGPVAVASEHDKDAERAAFIRIIRARGDLFFPTNPDFESEDIDDITDPPAPIDKHIFNWDGTEWVSKERYPGRKDLFFSPAAKITAPPPAPKNGKIFTWNLDWKESDDPHAPPPVKPALLKPVVVKPVVVKPVVVKPVTVKPVVVKPVVVKPVVVKPVVVKPVAVKPPRSQRNRLKDKGPEFDRVDLHLPEPWPAQINFATHTIAAPPDHEDGKAWVYDPYISLWKPDYKSLSRENLVTKFVELHKTSKAEEEAAAGPQGDPTSSRPSGREKITLSGRLFYIDYDNASRDRRKAVFTDPDTTESLVEPEESLLETVGITGDTRKAVQIYLNDFFDALPNCQTTTQMLTNRRCEVSYYVMWSVLLKARQEVVREIEDKRREGMPDQDVHQMQARLDAMGSVSKVRLDGSSSSSGACCDRDHEEHEDIKAIVENIKDNLEKARVDITNIKQAKRGGGLSEIERLFRRQTE